LFVDDGHLKVCLSAPSEGQVCFLTVSSIMGLAEAIEKALVAGQADWRKDKKGSKKGKTPF